MLVSSALRLVAVILPLSFLQFPAPTDTPFVSQELHSGYRYIYTSADTLDEKPPEKMYWIMSRFENGDITLNGRHLSEKEYALLQEVFNQAKELEPLLVMGISIIVTSASFVWKMRGKRKEKLMFLKKECRPPLRHCSFTCRSGGLRSLSENIGLNSVTTECYETPSFGHSMENSNVPAEMNTFKRVKRTLNMAQTPTTLAHPAGDQNVNTHSQIKVKDEEQTDFFLNATDIGTFTDISGIWMQDSLGGDRVQNLELATEVEEPAHLLPDFENVNALYCNADAQCLPETKNVTQINPVAAHSWSHSQTAREDKVAAHSLSDSENTTHGNLNICFLPYSGTALVSSSSSSSSDSDSKYCTPQTSPRSGYVTPVEEGGSPTAQKSVIHLIKAEPKDRSKAISYIEEKLREKKLSPLHKSVLAMRLKNHQLIRENASRSYDGGLFASLRSLSRTSPRRRSFLDGPNSA